MHYGETDQTIIGRKFSERADEYFKFGLIASGKKRKTRFNTVSKVSSAYIAKSC